MLLILTNSQDATADYLVSVLVREGVRFLRFDTDTGVQRTQLEFAGLVPLLVFDGVVYRPEQFTVVWYRRPERLRHPMMTETPEGKFILDEWAESLEGFFAHIPKVHWVNHPSNNVAASHKIEQLTTAKSLGFLVPDTLLTQDAEALRRFHAGHQGKVVVKPLSKGQVERPGECSTLIYTNEVSAAELESLDDLACCPTLFQQLIDKRADIRVTVVDQEVHAVELTALGPDGRQRCDIRRDNMQDVSYRVITLPPEVEARVRALAGHYGLRFAAIDLVESTTGAWFFLEVNPNGQWAWMDLIGVTDIAGSFVRSLRR
jgi:hypothetical protein